MPALYILRSTTIQKFYVGSALDLPARLAEHQRGHSPYTRNRGPWVLVYQEQFATLVEARHRERQVKSWKSHRLIEQMIQQAAGQGVPASREGQEFESPRACHLLFPKAFLSISNMISCTFERCECVGHPAAYPRLLNQEIADFSASPA